MEKQHKRKSYLEMHFAMFESLLIILTRMSVINLFAHRGS